MTGEVFTNRVAAFADRFLTERSFMLIVEPALADFAFDDTPGRPLGSYLAVLRAVGGALYDDITTAGNLLTFIGLALLPVAYHCFLVILCIQHLGAIEDRGQALAILAIVLVASAAPALACFWPTRHPRRTPEAQ